QRRRSSSSPSGGGWEGERTEERGSPTQNPPCIPPEGGKDPGSSQRRRSSSSPSGGGWEGERASTPPCPRSAFLAKLRALLPGRPQDDAPPSREAPAGPTKLQPLPEDALEAVLRTFVAVAVRDPALQAFAQGRDITTHYVIPDTDLAFHLGFHQGAVTAGLGDPPTDADVRLTLDAATLDGMLTGALNPACAALSGDIAFDGDTRLALTVQRVQKDLTRLYTHARAAALDD
ncbi:MAG: SCP2 sterol-binding domain-containing protein, partial [Anaerolineae bacterium]